MFLTFLGPPTSLMTYSTVNHQKLPFSDPTHLFDGVILEWSLNYLTRNLVSTIFKSSVNHGPGVQHLFSNFTKLLFILKEEFSFLHDSFDMHDCSSPLQCSFVIFATSSHSSSVTLGIPGLY